MSDESGFQIGRDAPAFYEAHVSRFMAPFVDKLVTSTVAPGQSVLDVACGTGFATRAAAAAAGPGARVEGSDLNPTMLAHARSVPHDFGLQLQWREASALELPYTDGEFDVVICQQGLQFFPEPAAGVREMARVTRDGGHIGITAWSAAEQSPFLHRETQMLARHGGGVQATFSAAAHDLRTWFTADGINDVSIEVMTVDVDLPPVRTFVPEHLKALPWSSSFFLLSAKQQAEALDELDVDLAEFRVGEGIRVPFSSFLVTATVERAPRRQT